MQVKLEDLLLSVTTYFSEMPFLVHFMNLFEAQTATDR